MNKLKKMFQGFWNRRYLLSELVKKGIKLKYRRSYLGIFWSLLEPLLMTIVLTIVFGTLYGKDDRTFPLYILCGRLLYSFFSQSTKVAAKSVRTNAGMIRKVYVPKYLYPMAGVIYTYITFLISLIVILPLGLFCGVGFGLHTMAVVLPLLIILGMTYGIGLILATVDVFFRDIEYLWDVILMVIMYTSAIFYSPDRLINSGFGWILKCNPLYAVIQNFRNIIFHEPMDMGLLAYSAGFTLVVLIMGHILFYKKQDDFILHI